MSLTIIKGTILSAPTLGQLDALPGGYLVAEDGLIRGVYGSLPEQYAGAPVEDWGDALILQSFADLHLHAPQYPMLGMGMDLPLLDWLNAYAFPTEARFADTGYAREIYSRLARELIANGTTRVCMFSSLHTDATLILMEELEKAGVTGYVGKVNMDRNAAPGLLEETTEESRRETLRWLDACQDFRLVKPMLTPRFTPSCTNELMAFLGQTGGGAGSPRPVPPVGEPGRDGLGAPAPPGLPAVLGDLCQIRPVDQPHRHGPLRLVRCAGAAGHAGRRRDSGPLRRLQPEHLLRRGAGAGHAE